MGIFSSSVKIDADMSGPKAEFVKQAILKDKVVIFSKSYCPYCTMAKEVSYYDFILIIFCEENIKYVIIFQLS